MFLGFLGFRFSELFSKKSIPHGSSGQTAMWKMIPYGSSSFQVFVKKCRKYLFLPIRFHFFMIILFPPFVRLRPVQAGFCVSTQTPGVCWIFDYCILQKPWRLWPQEPWLLWTQENVPKGLLPPQHGTKPSKHFYKTLYKGMSQKFLKINENTLKLIF